MSDEPERVGLLEASGGFSAFVLLGPPEVYEIQWTEPVDRFCWTTENMGELCYYESEWLNWKDDYPCGATAEALEDPKPVFPAKIGRIDKIGRF